MNLPLLATMVGAGTLTGIMINIALGYSPLNIGGILGGAVTGLLMFIL